MRSSLRFLSIFAIAILLAGDLLAQDVNPCTACTMHREKTAVLGAESDAVLLGGGSFALRRGDGKFVSLSADRTQLILYDQSGKFLRGAGSRGEGPGEFSRTGAWTSGRGDSILVVQSGRIDVFSPDLSFVRTFSFPVEIANLSSFIQTDNGTIVGIGQSPFNRESPLAGGMSRDFLYLLSPTGRFIRSFGRERMPDGCTACATRLVVPLLGKQEFIAIPKNEFVVERWNYDGKLWSARTVLGSAFPAGRWAPAASGAPPAPALTGAALDQQGILWVTGYEPNARWKPQTQPLPGRLPIVVLSRADDLDYSGITSVVVAVDTSTGRVLATARFEGEMMGMLSGGFAGTRRQEPSGIVKLDIWKLVLRRPVP